MRDIKSKIKLWISQYKEHLLHRKSLLYFLCIIFILMLFNAPWKEWLAKFDEHPIQTIILDGKPRFTQQEDIKVAIVSMGGIQGFFAQDIDQLGEQIQSLPWIKTVITRKQWPDRLRIWVNDYEPIARWNDTAFLSKTGVIFTLPIDKIPKGKFPHLFGNNEQTQLLINTWVEISNYLQKDHLTLKILKLNDIGSLQVILDNGLVLKLGRDNWIEKLKRFTLVYPAIDLPKNKKLDYIDLRNNTGAAIGMSEAPVDDINKK